MIISSFGSWYLFGSRLCTILIITVIKPTRPINISSTNANLLASHSTGVIPKLKPTVENADIVSNSSSIGDKSGSKIRSVMKNVDITSTEPTMITSVRLMVLYVISRLNSSVVDCP